jgi:Xaa-Pro aminopeptidase
MSTGTPDPFAPMDVAGRLPRLREALPGAGCDGLLVTNLTNIRYLTGFTGTAGMVAVLPGATVLITDGRYVLQADEQLTAAGVAAEVAEARTTEAQRQVLQALLGGEGSGARRLGLEAAHVTWARQRLIGPWLDPVQLVATEGLVEAQRRVKDAGEVARIARAAAIADQALAAVRPMLAERPSEADFGRELDFEMRRLGASGSSFETIVASGPNAAKPHARPTARRIAPGEAVVLDFGAVVDGYCSDMTRTVWLGELASPELVSVLALVARSQAEGVAAVGPGVPCAAVDRACRAVIEDEGRGDQFVHGTGHGVGLDIHEAPAVASTSADTLAAGYVVTVEPGIYVPGLGGIRIEDTVVVTGGGSYPLTHTPKDLVA